MAVLIEHLSELPAELGLGNSLDGVAFHSWIGARLDKCDCPVLGSLMSDFGSKTCFGKVMVSLTQVTGRSFKIYIFNASAWTIVESMFLVHLSCKNTLKSEYTRLSCRVLQKHENACAQRAHYLPSAARGY